MAVNQANILDSLDKICSEINIDEFFYDFLLAYGLPKSTVTRLRKEDDNRNVADGDGIALKKKIYFKKVNIGDDIETIAEEIKSSNVISQHDIRFVMVTDFQTLVAYDLKAEERLETTIEALPKQYAFFLPLAGYEKAIMHSEHPADIRASEKMGQLFDLIKGRNDLTTPEDIHALNVFLTRLLFCFYAEDTSIFEEGQMTSAIQSSTQTDGSDLNEFFSDLFKILNLDDNSPERKDMPAHFQAFPYVNGGLFQTDEPIPEFGRQARRILIDCGSLDWSQINPDIFGSMFQAVIDAEQRGNLGQHYTSVSNIMKVIQPLFLDPLYEDLEKARNSDKKLQQLLVRLENIRIFDPACGSGNFLIIAYKELRKLEMEVIDALNATGVQTVMYYSGIRLSQFYGIEIDDFAHEVAILSLWLAEHQMNTTFKAKFGYSEPTLPLRESGHIVVGNSLRIDWEDVCSKKNEHGIPYEVYICGNPPFLGKGSRSIEQSEDMQHVFEGFDQYKELDYVCCWFWLGAIYALDANAEVAFVSTNSISQGLQVATFFPKIFEKDVFIKFAYQSFPWSNNAKNNAGVYVVIIGLSLKDNVKKTIYKLINQKWHSEKVENISPYLISGPNISVKAQSKPIQPRLKMTLGNMAFDGGNLYLNKEEKEKLERECPESKNYIKRCVGTAEFIKSIERWCLWLCGLDADDIKRMPQIQHRVDQVFNLRISSKNKGTRELASRPHEFRDTNNPETYILIPRVSSSNRKYVPIGFFDKDYIPTDCQTIAKGTLYEFGILSSLIHNNWIALVSGRLGMGYRYSSTITYNSYPFPTVTSNQKIKVEEAAEQILLFREDYPDKTLADLYDEKLMPRELRDAHSRLDDLIDKLYKPQGFHNSDERIEYLLGLYQKIITQ